MRRQSPALGIAVVLTLAGCAAPEGQPSVTTEPATNLATAACTDGAALRHAMIAQVNTARARAPACGGHEMRPAPPLAWSGTLAHAARAHASDMATHDFVGHAGSDGRRVDRRATDAGYAWRAIGENVGAGADDAATAVRHWLGSPDHCRNLMNADYSEFGAACVRAPDSRYGSYWALILGEPRPD